MGNPARIEVLDPSEQRLAKARRLWEETEPGAAHELVPVSSYEQLSDRFDAAVIATTAAVRLAAIGDLLDRAEVPLVILEKFLFQSRDEYETAGSLLAGRGVRAWVNTPRRAWPGYVAAAADFADAGEISCRVVTGPRLAVATTAIHFLDVLSWLGGASGFELRADRLRINAGASRREGHVEFTGAVYGAAGAAAFEYLAHPTGEAPILAEFESPTRRLLVREAEQRAWSAASDDGWQWREVPFESRLQSELTGALVEDLLETGDCALPTYAESAALHQEVLVPLLEAYREQVDRDAVACPIT